MGGLGYSHEGDLARTLGHLRGSRNLKADGNVLNGIQTKGSYDLDGTKIDGRNWLCVGRSGRVRWVGTGKKRKRVDGRGGSLRYLVVDGRLP